MSTPVDPSGAIPMPWEHCAASIEGADVGLRNGGAIIARISCTGSAHDRCCELFGFLTGTRVDYGEEHSAEHGHDRYGRDYIHAAHPTWGPDAPIHLLGHSAGITDPPNPKKSKMKAKHKSKPWILITGGIAVFVFSEMVHKGYFRVWRETESGGTWVHTDSSWIRSVVTLQAPLKGTPGAGLFSAEYTDEGVTLPFFTMAHAMSIVCLLYDKLAPIWMQHVFEVESPFSKGP